MAAPESGVGCPDTMKSLSATNCKAGGAVEGWQQGVPREQRAWLWGGGGGGRRGWGCGGGGGGVQATRTRSGTGSTNGGEGVGAGLLVVYLHDVPSSHAPVAGQALLVPIQCLHLGEVRRPHTHNEDGQRQLRGRNDGLDGGVDVVDDAWAGHTKVKQPSKPTTPPRADSNRANGEGGTDKGEGRGG
jgi:hypothetical protein